MILTALNSINEGLQFAEVALRIDLVVVVPGQKAEHQRQGNIVLQRLYHLNHLIVAIAACSATGRQEG